MKRFMDIMISGVGLLLLAPVLLILALLVRVFIGSPVMFSQVRPGIHRRPFIMRKFRTMSMERDASGSLLPDHERLSRFGRFLRANSLDELPELWNVFLGEMSLVGPRSLLMEYLLLYTPEQARRYEVRPGITGWAQVNGRNEISWEERFRLDVWYVDNRSMWLDIRILLMTITRVVTRSGIAAPGEATMSRFTGTSERANQ